MIVSEYTFRKIYKTSEHFNSCLVCGYAFEHDILHAHNLNIINRFAA